jgi:hypothetical protein
MHLVDARQVCLPASEWLFSDLRLSDNIRRALQQKIARGNKSEFAEYSESTCFPL